ncbi:MAG TPA: NrsF family protein [Thermoanaerobaculia bacterium]|nr:NrsF family protein [Thermoanaerobaculia bacterium]
MNGAPSLPPELRRFVRSDLRPVRPLAAPARRALVLLVWAPVAVALVVAIAPARPDTADLGWLFSWGAVLAELIAGAGLVTLALGEAVPGRGAGRQAGLIALAGAASLFVVLAVLVRGASAGVKVPNPLLTHGPACLSLTGLIGLTALAVVTVLILRSTPLRASFAGLLAGAGTGLMGAGVFHLDCPVTHLAHVLVWHGGAVALLALIGLGLGLGLERLEERRMSRRLAAR